MLRVLIRTCSYPSSYSFFFIFSYTYTFLLFFIICVCHLYSKTAINEWTISKTLYHVQNTEFIYILYTHGILLISPLSSPPLCLPVYFTFLFFRSLTPAAYIALTLLYCFLPARRATSSGFFLRFSPLIFLLLDRLARNYSDARRNEEFDSRAAAQEIKFPSRRDARSYIFYAEISCSVNADGAVSVRLVKCKVSSAVGIIAILRWAGTVGEFHRRSTNELNRVFLN